MVVLGLDISSSSTGWAILKRGRFYKREGIDYGWIRPSLKFTLAKKLSFFRENLVTLLETLRPEIVVIEDVYYFRNPKTLKLLSRFSGVAVEAVKTTLGIDPMIETVKSIRTILGPQDKEEIFSAAIKKFKLTNWKFKTHNDIIDALIAALYGSNKEKQK